MLYVIKIAAVRGLKPDSIIVGNGSNEIIELLGHCFLRPGVEVVMGAQAFIVYKLVALLFGARPVEVPMPNFRHDVEALLGLLMSALRWFLWHRLIILPDNLIQKPSWSILQKTYQRVCSMCR